MPNKLDKPANTFIQGERRGWTTTLTVKELTDIVPIRPETQLSLLTETNRPITTKHRNSIESFLLTTPNWAMPAITLSATPDRIKEAQNRIEAEPQDLKILDGQHRIEAFNNVLNQLEADSARDPDGEDAATLVHLSSQQLPVIIYEVKTLAEHRQIFAWFAKQKPIEPAVRDFFDESNAFSKAAKTAMEVSETLKERTIWQKPSVPKTGPDSNNLLSLKQLIEITMAMETGLGKAPTPKQREQYHQQQAQQKMVGKVIEFFDKFLPNCMPNYINVVGNIRADRNTSYALHWDIIRLVAHTWAKWNQEAGNNPNQLLRTIGQLNLRAEHRQSTLVEELKVADITTRAGLKFKKLRDPAWAQAAELLLNKAKETA